MESIPSDLRYTEEHEWLRLEEELAVVGITDHAQDSLGDVTFLELPEVGSRFGKGDTFGVVESVKSASDLYMPVSGEVVAVNTDLETNPEAVNTAPYGAGWLVKIKPDDAKEIDSLLTPEGYQAVIE